MVGCFPGFCNFALQGYCQHDLICSNTVWTGLRVDTLKSVLHVFLLDTLKMTADWGSFYGFFFLPDWARPTLESESETHLVVSDSLQPHGLYSPWNSPGQNTGVGSLSLLLGTFPTQGSNRGLAHCRQILYWLSHKGSPRILEWVAYPFSSRSSRPRNWTGVSCTAGWFFTNWAMREAQPTLEGSVNSNTKTQMKGEGMTSILNNQ